MPTMNSTKIGLISGTGPQGRGLALRFAAAGLEVVVGSRDESRAKTTASELNQILTNAFPNLEFPPITATDNKDAVRSSSLVMLTVPFEHAESTLSAYREDFQPGSIFVDVTVPLSFGKGDVQVVIPEAGSGSRQLRAILPDHIPFTGAFKTLPAHVLEQMEVQMNCDTFVFGDDKAAKGRLMEAIRTIPGLRPVDVGGLSAAATVEGMTALLIRINRKLQSKSARFQVVGDA